MVRKGVSANAPIKDLWRVRILFHGAEVEHPVVAPVVVVKEPLRVLAAVAVEALDPARGVAHDDDIVCDVCEVWSDAKAGKPRIGRMRDSENERS